MYFAKRKKKAKGTFGCGIEKKIINFSLDQHIYQKLTDDIIFIFFLEHFQTIPHGRL